MHLHLRAPFLPALLSRNCSWFGLVGLLSPVSIWSSACFLGFVTPKLGKVSWRRSWGSSIAYIVRSSANSLTQVDVQKYNQKQVRLLQTLLNYDLWSNAKSERSKLYNKPASMLFQRNSRLLEFKKTWQLYNHLSGGSQVPESLLHTDCNECQPEHCSESCIVS